MFGDTADYMYSQTSRLTVRNSRLTVRNSRLITSRLTVRNSRLITSRLTVRNSRLTVRNSRLMFTVANLALCLLFANSPYVFFLKYRFIFGLLVFITRLSIYLSRP